MALFFGKEALFSWLVKIVELSCVVFSVLFFVQTPVYAQENPLNLPNDLVTIFQDYWLIVKNQPERVLPYLVIIIVLSFLLKILFNLLSKWRLSSAIQQGYREKGQLKQMVRDARQCEKQKDYLRAGEIYELANDLEKAKEMYKRGKGHSQVGRICERLEKWDQAAAFYETGQSYESAARVYQKLKNFQKAAELYLKAEKVLLAGEMYEMGKRYTEAARIYEHADYFQKAGWMYLSAHERPKAAEMFERYYLQECHKLKDVNATLSQQQRDVLNSYARKSGDLYLALGKYKEAASILVAGGFIEEAARAYQKAGEFQRAADLYLSVKQYDKAAEVLQEGGDIRQGDQFIGEKCAREERYSEAAHHFEQAQDFNQAGEMYELDGNLEKAGEMFLKGGEYTKASELFVAVGDRMRAAQAMERGQRLEEAARLYCELGDVDKAISLLEHESLFFEAAILKREQGKIEESILLLQKVDSQSEDYSEATLALARLFMDQGMYGPAREKYQRALARRPVTPETIEPYYHLATLQERLEDWESAMVLYERILAEDFQYKDVKKRLEILKRDQAEGRAARRVSDTETEVIENRYRLLRQIGRGGMGLVYQAEDMVLKRIVAYKILPESVRGNPKVLESFIQEARTAASIHHTNIVTIFDTGQSSGEYYITMEYVDGMSLKELLEKTPLLPITDVILISEQICAGLDYAHSKRVIHRDIKPGNVMVSREKVVKIMDFGLAKIVNDSMGETTGVKGTPLYMSPEQILGKEVDQQSDIYSLGCTIFRMITGKPSFSGGDVFYQHLHTPPPDPAVLNPKIPAYLNRIILKCLEKDKRKRYSRVKEILSDLAKGERG